MREDCPVDFKSAFKYYKRKQPPPDLGSVIDPERCEVAGLLERCPLVTSVDMDDCHTNSLSQWEAYRVTTVPGLTILRNVFSEEDQHYWAGRCLQVRREMTESISTLLRVTAAVSTRGTSTTPAWGWRWGTGSRRQ